MGSSLRAHLRTYWKHHVTLVSVLAAFAVALGGYGTHHYLHACTTTIDAQHARIVCGITLTPPGQRALTTVAGGEELGAGAISYQETPPAAVLARLNAAATAQANVRYLTLAAPEPVLQQCPVGNYSTRTAAKPLLWVIHDTESPNVPGRGPAGLQDVKAICAWFNNPGSQASSHYTTDADGNTLQMVPLAKKAWTQAGFNSVAISDEFIGYATQTSWPFAQLHAGELLAARDLKTYGIPAQHGLVNTVTCQVIRPGFVMHADLGVCGGSHHDAGTHFPVARFIADVKRILEPDVPAWYAKAKTLPAMWAWISWRDHKHPAALRPTNVPGRVPSFWWARYARHHNSR